MEDDDEFGGLYTDILVHAPPAPSNPPPPDAAAAETLAPTQPAPNPNPTPTPASTRAGAAAAADEEEEDDDWLLGGSDPVVGVDPTGDWADEEEDGGGAALAAQPPPKREAAAAAAKPAPVVAEEADPLMGGVAGDAGAAIPGLSSSAVAAAAAAGSEEWDSDSEDDIQIVLNETDGRRRLGEDEGDDEDGEDLVIVADGPIPGMEEQDWGEDAAAAGAEGERKEGGEPGKAAAAPGGRIGYSGGGQGFHPQHHSMFKYVRPGATLGAPLGGAPTATGQFRPPGPPGPFAGRGRGDWRPGAGRGMNKGFGYGMPPWGGSGRGFGGLDFTLPPHKTIFDIDVDTTFEEKPWKYPGADISDFFNFGLDDEKWKDYCKQLDQLRLESTMQSRIRVYESGRSEQDYDPDLPPELAAATGHHDISADSRNKTDNGHTDFNTQGRVPTSMRPPVMTGRPIQVETGYGERLPSIDTRLPRMRESDSVIEIVCQGQSDDPLVDDSTVDQTEKDSQRGDKRTHGAEEGRPYTSEMNSSSALGKEEHKKRLPVSSEGDNATDVNGRSSPSYRTRGSPRGVRSSKGSSAREVESSDEILPRQTTSLKRNHDSQREKNPDEGSESKDGPEGSPAAAAADEAADKLSADQFDGNDGSLALVDSAEVDGDDAISDPHTVSETTTTDGDNLSHSGKKQKLISRAEQPTGHNSSDQDELRTRNSDNSRGRSGSSKDNQKRLESGEEVLQDRRSRRINDARRHHDGEDRNSRRKDEYLRDIKPDVERSHLASRSREDTHHPYANRDRDMRGRSYDRVRDTEIWQRREESVHNRRAKEEDVRLEHNAEVGARNRNKMRPPVDRNDRDEDPHARKRLDDGDWRGSRPRERGDVVLNRRENIDDSHMKRKKDEENMRRMKPENEDIVHGQHGYRGRDDPNRRKRERDDGIDQKRRDDNARMREKADDRYHTKHKEDNWRQREREDRHRPKHDNTVTLQRDEGRGSGRGGRILDDKLVTSGRKQDETRSAGLSKEAQERSRQNDPLRRDQGAEENNMQNRGRSDVHPRDENPNNSERNTRQEKPNNTHDGNRLSSNSGARQASRDRYRESTRKGRSSDINEHDLPKSSKRRREDHESHRGGKVDVKGVSEQENSRDHTVSSKKGQNPQRESFVKQAEGDPMSDDENHEDSRRGRSKLERWTSHKEIDYSSIDNENAPTFSSIKSDVQAPTADELGKSEAAAAGNSELKSGGDNGQTSEKNAEERDRHLDTVERLKRRSERFKLPMPGEKDAPQSKKVDTEVQPPQIESASADLEVKPERPARKRRWTGTGS
uniref:Pre-mRNA polyadenylation factor Fip1 domain-containing protein n=1 Tax=Oryza meridionalis TaxID=40149 RepID=A0A0E0D5Y7_9ORYZ